MEQTTLIKKLSVLGLDEKEAETYICLLGLGTSPVSAISVKTGLNRSSLYVVLDRLQKQGLVSVDGQTKIRKYVPVQPERLERISHEKLEKKLLLLQNIQTLLPELSKLEKTARHRPRMQVLIGTENLRRSFEDTLSTKEKLMRIFSSAEKIARSFPDFLPIYLRERQKRGIYMRGIHPDDFAAKEATKYALPSTNDLTYVPPDKFKFPSDFGIFDNKIAFMSHEPALCVTIESEGLSDVMKALFDLAQEEARRIGRNPHAHYG